ncbi:rod shape-determining protein RodA [Syntrophus sp. (in: bacteria)]|uniref:rod shape-determining protein RodA n=1 Tax=Syntrophus sp. (in: bacteria) TaxID=48412 RepID=UPI00345E8F0D
MRFDRRLILNFDWTLLILVLILCTIGVLNIFSASYSFAGAKANPFYIRQLQWVLIGIFCMSIAFCIDYRYICQYAYVLHGIAIFCLVIVFFYGFATHGSQRWISLGSFSLQPSELVKLTLILALAKYFDEHKLEQGYYLRELWIPFLLLLVPFLMILEQPDLGTGLILLFVSASMFLFVGIRLKSLLYVLTLAVFMMPVGWFFMKEYQRERVLTFLNPERDPLGSGYHIIQSMIAIGSGGILGKGFLKGTQTQLQFLPEQQTDFVFSVFAEEWGFLGGGILILLFTSLVLWSLKIALHSRDFLGTLIAFGLASLLFWEVFINTGMVLGMMPVVGIPLPFLSYGGSAVVSLLTCIGLLLNVSMRRYILQP